MKNGKKWAEGLEADEKADLVFANLVSKHLKSNAIALTKTCSHRKGCGQTSRVDALRQSDYKGAKQFEFNLKGAVLASDAFSPSMIVSASSCRWDPCIYSTGRINT
jgi:phosphoribosylaminoimidazolecarboxamide formyltransferase/IMP cyclohydrolase